MRLLLAVITLTVTAFSQDTFLGYTLGASAQEQPRKITCRQARCMGKRISIGGLSLLPEFVVAGGQLVEITSWFNSPDFESFRSLLNERFGAAGSDASNAVQNRLGSSFQQETVTWNVGGMVVILQKYGPDLTLGKLVARTRTYDAGLAARAASAQKAAAKSF